MATIGAAVDANTKAAFHARADALAWSESRLNAELIGQFLAGEIDIEQPSETAPNSSLILAPPPPLEVRTEQVNTRLQPYHYRELHRLAKERKWHPGTYLASLTAAHIEARPVLCEAEINALRQVARQLADLGRNFNQIARALNSSHIEAHRATSVEFELVRMLIDLETTAVKKLMSANIRGWGITGDSNE